MEISVIITDVNRTLTKTESPKKIQVRTGFKPMTTAISVQLAYIDSSVSRALHRHHRG